MAGLLPRGISRVFRLPLRRSRVDDDVSDEIAFHLEMRAAELAARGWTPEAARAEARRRFGDTHHWSRAMSAVDRERVAQERRTEWLDDLAQDLRYGARSLRRAPLFSLLAVLTLALGIGANAAVFGVVKSVLLDALPYADAEHLARIHTRLLDGTLERTVMSSGTVTDVVARQRSFASVGAFEGATRNVIFAGAGGPVVLKMNYAEPALFRTLGVHAAVGRLPSDEDAVPDTAFNIVLTNATWQKLFFAGDPSIVGKPMVVNGISRTVVGVLPRGFVGPVSDAEVYFPLNVRSTMTNAVWSRRQHWLSMIGRLKPGVTVDAARRDLTAISAGLAREYPQYNGNEAIAVVPVRDDMVGDTRTPLLVLMASAAFVLLITCANLAGALLSRTISRRKEFAVRVALGAGRGRLVRQLLTESAVLAIAGGAAGLLLAWAGLHALRGLALRALPAYANLGLDRGAVLVTAAVALLTGIAFGLAPALAAGRANQEAALREEGRVASEGHRSRRLRGLLVAGQIALCVSLLAGAGLLARSLWAMTTSPIGFDADGVLAVPVQLSRTGYGKLEDRIRFFERFEERLRALPGVTAVASSGDVPTQVNSRNGMSVEGVPRTSDAQPIVLYATVSDDYFRTLGIPLRDGRAFGPQDGGEKAPLTIIVSEGTARRFWPKGRTVVGSRVAMGPGPNAEMATVVGVVGDVRSDPAHREPEPIMYHSIRQNPFNGPIFLVRTRGGDPMALARPIQRTLAALDPSLPIHNVTTLRDVLGEQLAGRRLPVLLMTAFGTLALVLASVGVYAMFAAMAAAREREFGVRVALGASRGAIAALVLRQGGVWMLAGLAAGALGVVAVTRMVRGLLYGVSPFDPLALGAAVVMLLACGVIALLGPVRRATRVDPIMALR